MSRHPEVARPVPSPRREGRVGVLAVACLAFALGQRFLSRHHLFRSLGLPLNLFVLILLVLLILRPVLDQMNGHVRSALKATAVFLGVTMGLKLLDILFFDRLPRWRNKPQVPHKMTARITKLMAGSSHVHPE